MKHVGIAAVGIAGALLLPVSAMTASHFGSADTVAAGHGRSVTEQRISRPLISPRADARDRFVIAQAGSAPKVALVIGNATYPDDNKPLSQPIADARAVAEELRKAGFDVVLGEDLTKQKLRTAIDNFKSKIKSGSAALLFFSGYGIQTAKQSYIIPVDAQIWTEGEVRRDGTSIESILTEMNAAGATVKLVVIDAARRNPFERRFRGYSAGLASLNAPAGTLTMYSAATDKVASDSEGDRSLFVEEFLKGLRTPNLNAEAIFNNTRMGVSRASRNEQVPWVSSSLVDEFYFGRTQVATSQPQTEPPRLTPPPPRVTPPEPPRVTPPSDNIQVTTAPPPKPLPEKDSLIQSLDLKISQNPRDVESYYKRGQAYAQKREYALATEDFAQVIRLSPNDPEAFNNRCFTRAVIGQLQAALSDCNEALRLKPNYVDALDSRGLANLKLGYYDRAITDYDAALRLNPRLASALYGRSQAKLKKGDIAGGNSDVRTARSVDPGIEDEFAYYGIR
jgi:tetratricopeptide (TPR) repeat protein